MIDQNAPIVAVIDDEEIIRESLAEILALKGYRVTPFESAEKALASPRLDETACFVTDLRLPGVDGVGFLERVNTTPDLVGPVIIMTGHGDINCAVEAMRKGAYDFFTKPFEKEVMLASVARAVEKSALLLQARELRREIEKRDRTQGDAMIGSSGAMEELRQKINGVAPTNAGVLITGETGVGKELVARALHDRSKRSAKRFVGVNLASLPESLAMGELFGVEKGAFTGADSRRIGKFEYANNGTLLLDEINSAPLSIQVGILRAIEERVITRLGGNEGVPVDTRIVATTNCDLLELSRRGDFREDLYHRLSVVPLAVPPLRDRLDDIPALVAHFLDESQRFYDKEVAGVAPKVLTKMKAYAWPGNIRELKNCVATLVLTAPGDEITDWTPPGDPSAAATALRHNVEKFERDFLAATLRQAHGNLKNAAGLLDIPQRSLFDKMRKYGLSKEDFK